MLTEEQEAQVLNLAFSAVQRGESRGRKGTVSLLRTSVGRQGWAGSVVG